MNKKITYALITLLSIAIIVYAFKLFILFFFNDVKLTAPNIVGMTVSDATLKVSPIGLNVTVSSEEFSETEKGLIISQIPEPDKEIKQQRAIEVVVSKGIQKHQVPNFRGLDLYAAKRLAEESGLKIKDISRTHHDFELEQVISSEPKAGSYVSGDNTISLLLSLKQAIKTSVIPDLTGISLSECEAIITKAGFALGEITYISNPDLDNDIIIDSSPVAGKEAPLGTVINITVNKKEE